MSQTWSPSNVKIVYFPYIEARKAAADVMKGEILEREQPRILLEPRDRATLPVRSAVKIKVAPHATFIYIKNNLYYD